MESTTLKMKPAKNKVLQNKIPAMEKRASFFEDVRDVARQIPKGRVTTYGALLRHISGQNLRRGWWAGQ